MGLICNTHITSREGKNRVLPTKSPPTPVTDRALSLSSCETSAAELDVHIAGEILRLHCWQLLDRGVCHESLDRSALFHRTNRAQGINRCRDSYMCRQTAMTASMRCRHLAFYRATFAVGIQVQIGVNTSREIRRPCRSHHPHDLRDASGARRFNQCRAASCRVMELRISHKDFMQVQAWLRQASPAKANPTLPTTPAHAPSP